jgi:hypothetical protein
MSLSLKNLSQKRVFIGLVFAGSASLTLGCGSTSKTDENPSAAQAPAENPTPACITLNHPIYFAAPTAYMDSTKIAFGKPEGWVPQNFGTVTFDHVPDSATVQGPYTTTTTVPHPDGHLALQILSTQYPYQGNQASIIGTVWIQTTRQQKVLDTLNSNTPPNPSGVRFQHGIQDVCITAVSGETSALYETLYFARIGLDVKIANPASPLYNKSLPKILLEW